MKQDNQQNDELSPISWHPAFVEAIQMELEEYSDSLEFYPEYQLGKEPLKIDCVVIKKAKDLVINKNIAKIFREANLLEYKSPDDYISVDDFYKVYGYACLYASFERLQITGLTITFVESRYPEKLIRHLTQVRGYDVEENSPGIYSVKGDIIPVQIIDNRRLSADENLWLKSLTDNLDPSSIIRINDEVVRHDKTVNVKMYLNVIAKANYYALEEAMEMREPAKSLEEVLIRTGVMARAEERAEARTSLAIARNLADLGIPFETVVLATKLDPEKIKPLYEKQPPVCS